MSTQAQAPRTSLVLSWDDYLVRVRCPFCLYSHGHAFASHPPGVDKTQLGWQLRASTLLRRRRSDCVDVENGGDYRFIFPGEAEAAGYSCGWEFDRYDGRFVTVDSQGIVKVPINDCRDGRTLLPQYQAQHENAVLDEQLDDLDGLAASMEDFSIHEEHTEDHTRPFREKTSKEHIQELLDDPTYRRNLYFSSCCNRELQDLRSLCSQYPGDHLIGSVDNEGDTGSLLAATEEGGLDVLKWLHHQGDPLDRSNHYGRTPLMEAALWGRIETVRFLIAQGASLTARDANDMRAVDLVADTERNAKERTTRASVFYREAPNAKRRREQIKALFEDISAHPTAAVAAPARRAFFDRKPDGSLDILRPQEMVEPPLGQLQKAFATLDRGPNYPYINAMSGYTQAGWPNVLDNTEWTSKALELQKLFGLRENKKTAAHVEVQLLTYLFDRHSIFPYAHGPFRDTLGLRSTMPPYTIKPIISISKPKFCPACKEFIGKFRAFFPGLHVVLQCVDDTVPHPLDVESI